MDIKNLRNEINIIDDELRELFKKRMDIVRLIGEYKKTNNLPTEDKMREDEVIKRNLEKLSSKELEPYYMIFLNDLMNISKKYQNDKLRGK